MVETIRGLTRPFVTAAMTVTFCYGTIVNLDGPTWDKFVTIYAVIVTFWFIDRKRKKAEND